jgi:hypothetical protein
MIWIVRFFDGPTGGGRDEGGGWPLWSKLWADPLNFERLFSPILVPYLY